MDKEKIVNLPAITIGMVGEPTAFFQATDFACSQNILILKNKRLNTATGLFLTTLINIWLRSIGFEYGRPLSLQRFLNGKIKVPTSNNTSLNWDYMEQYVVNTMKATNVPELKPIQSSSIGLHSVKWHEFKISDIMNVLSGVRLTSSDMKQGNVPFIGASDSNNGITNWTSDTNSSTDNNVLGINYNGSVGEVFYHPYVATFSDDVKRLKLKQTTQASKEVYLFIKTMLLQQKSKYAYGYKFNGTRMKAQKIMLPVTAEDTPNWKFMEDYIKSISNSHLI